MSLDAVVLLRVPEWEPPEELDLRELDDAVLVYLDVPFESDDDEILDALEAAVGDAMYEHEDDRGIFVLPDAADPEDAESYDAVIAAVGEVGRFLPLDAEQEVVAGPQDFAAHAESLLGQVFESMGLGSGDEIVRALRDGDRDVLQMAQIRMQGMLEQSLHQASMPELGARPTPAEDAETKPEPEDPSER